MQIENDFDQNYDFTNKYTSLDDKGYVTLTREFKNEQIFYETLQYFKYKTI